MEQPESSRTRVEEPEQDATHAPEGSVLAIDYSEFRYSKLMQFDYDRTRRSTGSVLQGGHAHVAFEHARMSFKSPVEVTGPAPRPEAALSPGKISQMYNAMLYKAQP